jgi:hypothetical protein
LAIRDYQGETIKLTASQWEHIEWDMTPLGVCSGQSGKLWKTQRRSVNPEKLQTLVGSTIRRYIGPEKGDKWVCVVVKFMENDAFISTAYLTRRIILGELIWRKER